MKKENAWATFWGWLTAILIVAAFVFFVFLPLITKAGTVTTSDITAQTIIDRAKRNLNATYESGVTDPLYGDNEMIQWTDEAVREVVNLTRCLEEGPITFALTQDTYRYDPSGLSNFLDIAAILFDSGVTSTDRDAAPQIYTLDRVNKIDIGHNYEKGRPKVYCIFNNQIEIWPIPGSAESGASVHVFIAALPSGVTATTSNIETPAYLDTALVYYVTALGFYKDANIQAGDKFMALFDQRVKEYLVNVLRREPIE